VARALGNEIAQQLSGNGWTVTIALKGTNGYRAILTRPARLSADASVPEATTGANVDPKPIDDGLAKI
jgi:hypothetical protein